MSIIKPLRANRLLLLAGAMTTVTFASGQAFAQQVTQATQAADPSRAANDIMADMVMTAPSGNIDVAKPIIQNAPEGSENIKFTLSQLTIDGANTYDASSLSQFYQNKLGTEVSLAEVYGIASSITNYYRNNGYILTQVFIPPQEIEKGAVKIQVVEGFVDQIILQGVDNPSEARIIEGYISHLKDGKALNSKALERNLLLINDLPGISARSVLSPSKTVVGSTDVIIIVEKKPYDAEIGFDNLGSKYLGNYQGYASGSLNSAFGMYERINARMVTAGDVENPDELLYGSLSYEQPINKYGTKVSALANITTTEPGYTLEEFDVNGKSEFLSVGVTHPFIRSRTTNLSGRVSFDWRDVDSRNNLEPNKRKDRIRSLRLGSTYQMMDTMFGQSYPGVNAADIEISKGWDIFGATADSSPNKTRALGNPEYTKLNVDAQRLQRIVPKVNILANAKAQWASSPLLSSEEFGVGGFDIGRGYDSSEIVGDDGISAKLELQWNTPKELKYVKSYQLYAFLDAGKVWNQDPTTDEDKTNSLTSTGLGVRADITDATQAGFGVGLPLTRDVETRDDKSPRFFFNISHKF